ncbi:hypothetical protein AAF712_015752, partial [Marasmius tenuissimus]
MQFKLAFITTALLASASPAMSATLKWYSGAGCTGSVIGTSNGASSGQCIFLTNGGSAKSIGYNKLPHTASFFISGGGHDKCTGGSSLSRTGSGCATAPAG